MSRVDFAYGAAHRLLMACRTVARHVQAGQRLLVYCTDARRLRRFDALLWQFDPVSFIPHAAAADPLAEHADVVLVPDALTLGSLQPADWLLNLDLDCPPDAGRFARILEIVSRHEADIQAARSRWVLYHQSGHQVIGHPLSPGNPGATPRSNA